MSETTRVQDSPASVLRRVLPFVGFAAIAVLALAWNDRLPGGYFLRGLVDANRSRAERELALHAAERLRRFDLENERASPDAIVFVGSSTIERFPLEACFPGKPCLNRGILSASAPLLEKFVGTLIPSVPSGGIVLYAGSIDLRAPGRSADAAHADEVAASVRTLLDAVRRHDPTAPIALIGVLPARHMNPAEVQALAHLNARLSSLARERGIAFVDTARAPLTSPTGSLAEELSADDLHLDERGYRALSAWIVADGGEVGRRLAP